MAEVIWRDLAGDEWEVHSAGSEPSGFVHPLAIRALSEINLPSNNLISKSTDPYVDQAIDLAVTVCDNAREACPMLPGVKETVHWPFDDPADAGGTEEEKMAVFRRVRDEIMTRIASYLGQSTKASHRMSRKK